MVRCIRITHAWVKVAFRREMAATADVAVSAVTRVYFISSDWKIQRQISMWLIEPVNLSDFVVS